MIPAGADAATGTERQRIRGRQGSTNMASEQKKPMERIPRETQSLATIEACNALKAETFTALPEDIPLWRFREVLLRLCRYLRLSDGAVTYALDLMGLLTEADWRGDGRPVTYHSVRGYARKVRKTERTISNYESQLIAAGLAHRTLKHARRHGGQGKAERRTGLDWRAFGVALPDLMKRIEARNTEDQRCLDLENRIRSERRIILGLADALDESRALRIKHDLDMLGASPLQACLCVGELEPILTSITLLRASVTEELDSNLANQEPEDNPVIYAQESEQSESSCRVIDTTRYSSSPSEKRRCSDNDEPQWQRQAKVADNVFAENRQGTDSRIDALSLPEIWEAAPLGWKSALGHEVDISWPILIEIAGSLAPQLDVSAYAWNRAIRILGPSEAALALMVLDRNRSHPSRPVFSVGGALVGMIRRAEQGEFNLAPSVYGIMSRSPSDDVGEPQWQP